MKGFNGIDSSLNSIRHFIWSVIILSDKLIIWSTKCMQCILKSNPFFIHTNDLEYMNIIFFFKWLKLSIKVYQVYEEKKLGWNSLTHTRSHLKFQGRGFMDVGGASRTWAESLKRLTHLFRTRILKKIKKNLQTFQTIKYPCTNY